MINALIRQLLQSTYLTCNIYLKTNSLSTYKDQNQDQTKRQNRRTEEETKRILFFSLLHKPNLRSCHV